MTVATPHKEVREIILTADNNVEQSIPLTPSLIFFPHRFHAADMHQCVAGLGCLNMCRRYFCTVFGVIIF